MTDDIKLMAKFMGPRYFCETPHEEWETLNKPKNDVCRCGAFSSAHPVLMPTPDYPNDMTALLEVMDKMYDELFITVDIDMRRGTIIFWKPVGHGVYVIGCYADLPNVLFPLLVEAIKSTPEEG